MMRMAALALILVGAFADFAAAKDRATGHT